jgi:hypothetical protein
MTYLEGRLVQALTDPDRNRHPVTLARPNPSAKRAAHDKLVAPEDVLGG